MRVTKTTRARKEGTTIICPKCFYSVKVYHFGWASLVCLECEEEIDKEEFILSLA